MFNRIHPAATLSTAVVRARIAQANASYAVEKKIDRIKERKARREQVRYDAMIKASQDKIGEYKPASIPVQVWA